MPEVGKFTVSNGLNFRVALGSYRLFYTGGSEDFFFRHRPQDRLDAYNAAEERYTEAAAKRLEEWINKPAEPEAEDEGVDEDGADAADAADAVAAA